MLVDEELADLVWQAWNASAITHEQSSFAWLIIAAEFVPNLSAMDNVPTVN